MSHRFEFKGRLYVSQGRGRSVTCVGMADPTYSAPALKMPADPVELIIWRALVGAQIPFTNDPNKTNNLDFKLLTEPAIYIECKQFHSSRITEQMSRAKDVIAIQGIEAANFFAGLLK